MGQAPKSSVFSRKIVNLFAGMAFGSPDLPPTLKDAAYSCHSIEQSFTVETNFVVNPEVVLCSDMDQHTLIVEAKSGANLNPAQLERYTLVNPECLQKSALTTASAAKKHDLLVIGLEQWKDRLLLGSSKVPSDRRVIAVADIAFDDEGNGSPGSADSVQPYQGIMRIENQFSTPRLNDAFNPTLEVDWDVVPNIYLPVDHESLDWEFAEFMMPEIISAILRGDQVMTLEELAATVIRHWKIISAKYQTMLLDCMRRVLKQAAQKRFSSFMKFGEKGKKKNEVVLMIPQNLTENIAAQRAQLNKRLRDFMEDLNSPQIAMIYEA